MITRTLIRQKVVQILYAYLLRENTNVEAAEKELTFSLGKAYDLYLYLLLLMVEVKHFAEDRMALRRLRLQPTEEDLNPNMKFVNNRVIWQMENNLTLKQLWPRYHVLWENDTDLISKLFREIEQLPEYEVYMSTREGDYKSDKKLVLAVIEKVFATNDLLHWFLGEKNTHWIDDYEEAMLMFYQNVKEFKEEDGDNCKISTLFKSDEDEQFCRQLFRKTLENADEYTKMVEAKLQNWELERVISMDMLLMQMALCELLEFPSVPIKVTLNEYIELAKWYSSDKSKVFVNGILDRLIVDLRDSGRLVKTGRGLYQN